MANQSVFIFSIQSLNFLFEEKFVKTIEGELLYFSILVVCNGWNNFQIKIDSNLFPENSECSRNSI